MSPTRKYLIGTVAVLALAWILSLVSGGKTKSSNSGATGGIVAAAGQSQTATTSASSRPADGQLLPPDYAVLQERSAFGRGHGHGHAGGPDATFVFEGTIESPKGFTAFVENTAGKNVLQVANGDSLARGHVRSINMNSMEYDVAGSKRTIQVGQNLNGETPPPPPAPPPAAKPQGPQNGPPKGGPQQMPPGTPMPPPGADAQGQPNGDQGGNQQ